MLQSRGRRHFTHSTPNQNGGIGSLRPAGRGKKKTVPGAVSKLQNTSTDQNDDEVWMCELCHQKFIEDDSKLMQCERCNLCFCIKCLDMPLATCQVLNFYNNYEFHWFCSRCKEPALHAIRHDREIEQRCQAYFEKVAERLDKIEDAISLKVDKVKVDSILTHVKHINPFSASPIFGQVQKYFLENLLLARFLC